MLPKGWAEASIGDVTSVRTNKVDPATLGAAPFIGLEHIEPHTGRLVGQGAANDVRSTVAQFKAGDILFGRLRPYLNKVVEASFDGCASAEIVPFTPEEGVNLSLLRRVMMSPEFLAFTASLDKGDRPRVSADDVNRFKFSLPPTAEQRRIVAKLDALIARLARARTELDRVPVLGANLRRSMLANAFSGKLTAACRSDENAGSQSYPLTWEVRPLGEISEIQGGIQVGKKRPSGTVLIDTPYLRVANVQRGWLKLDEIKSLRVSAEERRRLILKDGDILMNEGGDRDKLGRGWVWRNEVPNCIHQNHVFRIRLLDPDFPPEFVSHFANEFGQQYFIDQGTQTTNLASISKTKVAALPVPIPPVDEAREIARLICEAFARAERLEAEASRARTLIDRLEAAILARAFRGELVPQDPTDEPASVLLERIKSQRAAAPSNRRRRQKVRSKGNAMAASPTTARERLIADSRTWPDSGLRYEEIARRMTLPHDEIRDAIFELLSGPEPVLRQVFDKTEEQMLLQRIAA